MPRPSRAGTLSLPRPPLDDSMTECPMCGWRFSPLVIYTVEQLARHLHVARRTVAGWIASGRLSYRVRHVGVRVVRIIDWPRVVRFMDIQYPDPFIADPNDKRYVLQLWRKGRNHARNGSLAGAASRRQQAEARHALAVVPPTSTP